MGGEVTNVLVGRLVSPEAFLSFQMFTPPTVAPQLLIIHLHVKNQLLLSLFVALNLPPLANERRSKCIGGVPEELPADL